MIYKLSDEVISQIARLVQLGILTGTDVVDNLRMMEVTQSENDDSSLVLSDEYREVAGGQIEKLMSEVSDISQGE
jgi:hypothetical protein